jgi:hypothetical protein
VIEGKNEPSDQELGDYLMEGLTDGQQLEAVLTYKKMAKKEAVDQYREYLKGEEEEDDGDESD